VADEQGLCEYMQHTQNEITGSHTESGQSDTITLTSLPAKAAASPQLRNKKHAFWLPT
jgi:hypothetical protein